MFFVFYTPMKFYRFLRGGFSLIRLSDYGNQEIKGLGRIWIVSIDVKEKPSAWEGIAI